MISNLDLYGREDVPKVPKHVCDFRLQLLEERLKELMAVHWMEQDINLINQVQKAQTFWRKLRNGEEHE